MLEKIRESINVHCMATVALVFVVMHLKWLADNPSVWATNGFSMYENVICSQRVRTLMRPNEISRLCRKVSTQNRLDCLSFYTNQVDACKNAVMWFNDNFHECLIASFRTLTIYGPSVSATVASSALLYVIVRVGKFSASCQKRSSVARAETTRDKTIRILFCFALIAIVLVTATSFTTSSLQHMRHEPNNQSVFCGHDNTFQYVLIFVGVLVTIGFVGISLVSIWPQFRRIRQTSVQRQSNRTESENTSMTSN